MENNHDGTSEKGVLVPVSENSDFFHNNILAPLQSAYLYEESKQCFSYKSANLIKNPVLEAKYNSFRAKKREVGYSEEDLKETYGFLLFDDADKANTLGETGVLTGNSTCTTLGDPSKGVYISMYSDCLDPNHWYNGKSGYIAIVRLTKGKVKEVLENYTQSFTAPSGGFDCHVSEQLSSVSPNTSSFLAFERTQYYLYELLANGSNEAAQSPSLICPFAVVSFSYTDAKATHEPVEPHEKSEEKKMPCHYLPWRGQLQIGPLFYNVGLRTTAGALIPVKLPAVVKIDRAISMLDLRQLLPTEIFETCFTGEVCLDGTYCSQCELVSSADEEVSSLSLLIQELTKKDLALTCQLNDGGFLVLLHLPHLLTYNDTLSNATEVLHGIFVFPDSRVIKRDTKIGQSNPASSSEILRVLPALNYAEGEVEKTPTEPSEELREVLLQHMQSYAALINPGLAASPSREVCIFPDQYDLPDVPKHLYSAPTWTNRAWQGFRSYLAQPVFYQVPVSKALEILGKGFENRREDLDLEVYISLSSPEEVPATPASISSEDQLGCLESTVPAMTFMENHIPGPEAQVDSTIIPQNEVPDVLQAGDSTKDTEKTDLTVLNKNDNGAKNVLSPASDDLPTELIVSITSAEKTAGVTDNSLSVTSAVPASKHNEIQLSGLSTAKLQMADMNSVNDEIDKKSSFSPMVNNPTKKRQTFLKRHSRGFKKAAKPCARTSNLQTLTVEDDNSMNEKHDQDTQTSGHVKCEPSDFALRKLPKRSCKFEKLPSKNKKVKSADVNLTALGPEPDKETVEGSLLMELDASLRRKMDLKPIITKCRRILVPYGSSEFADQIKSLKVKWESAEVEQCNAKMLTDAPVKAHDTIEMESSTALETMLEKTETTKSTAGGNLQNTVVDHVKSEPSNLKQTDGGNDEKAKSNDHSSENVAKADLTQIQIDSDTCSSEVVQEKHTDRLQLVKRIKSEVLLRKLKSALLRGKRKTDHSLSEKVSAPVIEPCLKKSKGDSDAEMLKRNDLVKTLPGINEGAEEVSKILPVDPRFAHALGLTPRKIADKVQNTEGQDPQLRRNLSKIQEQVILDKQPQPRNIQRHPSVLLGKSKVKTLKKRQDIPAEYIKQQWWLHFQTPGSFAKENLTYKESCRDSSARNNLTDALTLLADLALGASSEPTSLPPDTALERKPDSCVELSDLTKNVTSVEQESVLHALLRQPAARPILSLESPSPIHPVGSTTVDLNGLICKEHAYSLPSSASPGLSGTPSQVSPLSGSTGLHHHNQKMHDKVIQTPSSTVSPEERSGHNQTSGLQDVKKQTVHRRKFRCSRYIVNNDGCIHITRVWQENYDFNLDSKFTTDKKDKTVIRALHGPWDFTIEESIEELRLIVHMWIGLFYSRSTARLFHIDKNCTHPYLEESDDQEMTSVMAPTPDESELKTSASAPSPITTSDTSVSKALDLSKKETSGLNTGSVILDLSLRNRKEEVIASDRQVERKEISVSYDQTETVETLNLLKPSVGPHEGSTAYLHQTQSQAVQCYRERIPSIDISEVDDDDNRSIHENTTTDPSLEANCQECADPESFKSDGTHISLCEEMANLCFQTENIQTSSGSCHILHGSENETTDLKDSFENFGIIKVQKLEIDSSETMAGKGVNSSNQLEDVVHTDKHDDNELQDGNKSKDGEHWNLKDGEGNIESSVTAVDTGDDSHKESATSCDVNLLQNEEQLTREDPKKLDSCQTEDVYENKDHHAAHKGKEIRDEVHSGKEDGPDMKDTFVAGSDLNDQPVSMMCDSPASRKEDCITECNGQASLDEQPPPTDSEKVACSDLLLRTQCTNGSALTDEHAISVEAPCTEHDMPLCMEPCESIEKAKLENSDICSADTVNYLESALHSTDENTNSLDGPFAALPKIKGDTEQGNQNSLPNDDCEDQVTKSEDGVTKSVERKRKNDDITTQKAELHHQSHLAQGELVKNYEAQLGLAEKEVVEKDSINEGLEVVIPFIGVAVSRQQSLHPQMSLPQAKGEEVLQDQEVIQYNISETVHHEGILTTMENSISQMNTEKMPLPAGKESIFELSETSNQLVGKESESDDRCPTPTMDEKPYDHIPCSDHCHRTYPSSGSEVSKNSIQKDLIRNSPPIQDEFPLEQKSCLKSTAKTDSNPQHGLSHGNQVNPDLELRTQRVLRIIDEYLSRSIHMDKSRQCETADMHDQAPNPNSKTTASSLASDSSTANFKKKKTNMKPVDVSGTTEIFKSHSKCKLEEVLDVNLKANKTDMSVPKCYPERTDKVQEISLRQDSYYPSRSLQRLHSNKHKAVSHHNLGHELCVYNQQLVMAVKPSKNDEGKSDCSSKERKNDNPGLSVSRNTDSKIFAASNTTQSVLLLEKTTENFKGFSEGLGNTEQKGTEFSSKGLWASNDHDKVGKFNIDKAEVAMLYPLHHYQGTDSLDMFPSSSFSTKSSEGSSKIKGNQDLVTHSSVEKTGQTTKEKSEIEKKYCSDPVSASVLDNKGNEATEPHSSIVCTIFNSNTERSYSLLECVSQRCIQNDLTLTSIEQECLIFSEQMKQLLKRSARIHIQDKYDKPNLSCNSPLTVQFSNLEEEEDSVDHTEGLPSLVGHKIKVDVSERRRLEDTAKEERILNPQKLSYGIDIRTEHTGVSGVTAECARQYKAMMDGVCTGKKLSSRTKGSHMERGYPKTEPSNHFDFSGQMKREMYEQFHSSLNSVLKQSSKTKFRFFILATSADIFFEKTKVLLEAEGHTAVQPSQFFHGEESPSSLLIILRNEDIAEHICEVPHLLELKMSPDVLFAGIDEPDDILNLNYQELFTRGGLIMFDRATLEPLSLCKMKRISEIVQKLNTKGKWKWMLHYRDSRRLKESARLNAEAMEKQDFLTSCQEAGILEVLPYHECDLASRDPPNYLTCLVNLQVQNISARYSVFVTDATTDTAVGRNGILTMTVSSFMAVFMAVSPNETFPV